MGTIKNTFSGHYAYYDIYISSGTHEDLDYKKNPSYINCVLEGDTTYITPVNIVHHATMNLTSIKTIDANCMQRIRRVPAPLGAI